MGDALSHEAILLFAVRKDRKILRIYYIEESKKVNMKSVRMRPGGEKTGLRTINSHFAQKDSGFFYGICALFSSGNPCEILGMVLSSL